ncbi:MAG: hypothetical protein IJT27_10000 [Clostridia bacterium]|nr:hypothetical protein [Clostridia bacterium]
MAAHCPKCNYKLKLSDWRPECPKCGVNVLYYGIEEELRKEADTAEYHYAKRQPKFDRLKFSLIGHPLSIVRIALGLLPIVATLLPMGTVEYVLPFGTTHSQVNLISIINFLINSDIKNFDLLLGLFNGILVGKAMIFWAVALVSLVLMVLVTLIGWFFLTLSCSPKGMRRNIGFPIVGIVLSTVSFVSFNLMIKALSASLPGIFTGSANPTAYIAAVLIFVAMIVINVIYKRKNIPVKYKDVSEYLIPYSERPSTIAKQKEKEEAPAAEPVNA